MSLHERNPMQVARAYTDFAGLNDIKATGREDSAAGLRQVAEQFEAIFIDLVLDSMRKASAAFSEGNYLQSNETEFHQQNFDNQLSLHLAGGRGIGLAESLYQQMLNQYQGDLGSAGSQRERLPISRSEAPKDQSIHEGNTSALFDGPQDFVKSLLPHAEKAARELGVDPQFLLAQSALETGWGRKLIASNSGEPSYNLFAIKADASWQGKHSQAETIEFKDGLAEHSRQNFRNYDSYQQAFDDYINFLTTNPRYENALAAVSDNRAFAQELQHAGYATDPEYAQKINSVLQSPVFLKAIASAQRGVFDG